MIGIAAVVFEQGEPQAQTAFKEIRGLAHSRRVHLETAVVGVRQENGQYSFTAAEAWDDDKTGSNSSHFWHRILHHAPDAHRHDNEFVTELGDKITPGGAAVFVSFELRYRPETLAELGRLGGALVVNELSQEQKEALLADIRADELSAQNRAYKKREKGELMDEAAEDGIQNIE